MGDLKYHLGELALVQDLANPRRIVPQCERPGMRVLDVGCGMGQTLTAVEFAECSERHGIDVDAEAIQEGQRRYPEFNLRVARAEDTGYPDRSFDLIFSRVAIPYTNIPVALRELHRVLKPGGQIWLTLHSWSVEKPQLKDALLGFAAKRLMDRAYVLINSACLQMTGRCFARPWNGSFESLQFASGFGRLLKRHGFADIRITRQGHLLAQAHRPSEVPAIINLS